MPAFSAQLRTVARSLQVLAENAQIGERVDNEILQIVKSEVRPAVSLGLEALEKLAHDPATRWNVPQRQLLTSLQVSLKHIADVSGSINPLTPSQLTPSATSTNLNGLVRQAVSRFLPIAQTNGLTLTADLPQEIILAAANPTQIAQVLDCLISNAMRYCNASERVWLHLERTPENTARVCVSDNGRGMTAQMATRIFEPLFQPESDQRLRFGGLGIRLSLAREIILRFNGKIWVETKPNQGSRFYFTLPVAR